MNRIAQNIHRLIKIARQHSLLFTVWLLSYSISCSHVKFTHSDSPTMPDLIILDITCLRGKYWTKDRFGRSCYVGPPLMKDFNIWISNGGGVPFNGELALYYTFSESVYRNKSYSEYSKIIMASFEQLSPYEMQEYSISFIVPVSVYQIFFVVNPEDLSDVRKPFYVNNEYVFEFKEK